MSSILKKILLAAGIFTIILLVTILCAAWYLGVFSSVNITTEIRGPYYFVYLEHKGAYHLISPKIEKVREYLEHNNIQYIYSAGMYFDDPAKVEENELRSYAGFLIADSIKTTEPFQFIVINERNVVLASIETHPMIAPFKVYPAFHEWMENNKDLFTISGAPLEVYKPEGRVEVEFPIKNIGKN